MKAAWITSVLMGLLMASSAALTVALTPTVRIADQKGPFSLAQIVPSAFGDWHLDTTMAPLQVDPRIQAKLDKLYNQTLSRTYVNPRGQRLMLSIAYGGDQSDYMAVHKPEACYAAQGFDVTKAAAGTIATPYGAVPVKRLLAVRGSRTEPITYWVTVGDRAIRPDGLTPKLQQLRYGLTGKVPDGMLVRVSSIAADEEEQYLLQSQFIEALLAAIAAPDRTRFVGVFPE
jgi:EpsI family protein